MKIFLNLLFCSSCLISNSYSTDNFYILKNVNHIEHNFDKPSTVTWNSVSLPGGENTTLENARCIFQQQCAKGNLPHNALLASSVASSPLMNVYNSFFPEAADSFIELKVFSQYVCNHKYYLNDNSIYYLPNPQVLKTLIFFENKSSFHLGNDFPVKSEEFLNDYCST
jgi:hypothetical protein